MMDENIVITQVAELDSSIEQFKQQEWKHADEEHYGLGVDLSRKDYCFCAKNEAGMIVGVLEMNVQADLASITTLLVGVKSRRKGVGKRLLKMAEKIAIEAKCKKIWLETNEGWEAEHFYLQAGYKVEAKLKRHILNQTSLVLVKFLGDED